MSHSASRWIVLFLELAIASSASASVGIEQGISFGEYSTRTRALLAQHRVKADAEGKYGVGVIGRPMGLGVPSTGYAQPIVDGGRPQYQTFRNRPFFDGRQKLFQRERILAIPMEAYGSAENAVDEHW
jgi:hypothetical protein